MASTAFLGFKVFGESPTPPPHHTHTKRDRQGKLAYPQLFQPLLPIGEKKEIIKQNTGKKIVPRFVLTVTCCGHDNAFSIDRIIIKLTDNQDRHKILDELKTKKKKQKKKKKNNNKKTKKKKQKNWPICIQKSVDFRDTCP